MVVEILCATGVMSSMAGVKSVVDFKALVQAQQGVMSFTWNFTEGDKKSALLNVSAEVETHRSDGAQRVWSGIDPAGWPISLQVSARYTLRYGPAHFVLSDCQEVRTEEPSPVEGSRE